MQVRVGPRPPRPARGGGTGSVAMSPSPRPTPHAPTPRTGTRDTPTSPPRQPQDCEYYFCTADRAQHLRIVRRLSLTLTLSHSLSLPLTLSLSTISRALAPQGFIAARSTHRDAGGAARRSPRSSPRRAVLPPWLLLHAGWEERRPHPCPTPTLTPPPPSPPPLPLPSPLPSPLPCSGGFALPPSLVSMPGSFTPHPCP